LSPSFFFVAEQTAGAAPLPFDSVKRSAAVESDAFVHAESPSALMATRMPAMTRMRTMLSVAVGVLAFPCDQDHFLLSKERKERSKPKMASDRSTRRCVCRSDRGAANGV